MRFPCSGGPVVGLTSGVIRGAPPTMTHIVTNETDQKSWHAAIGGATHPRLGALDGFWERLTSRIFPMCFRMWGALCEVGGAHPENYATTHVTTTKTSRYLPAENIDDNRKP